MSLEFFVKTPRHNRLLFLPVRRPKNAMGCGQRLNNSANGLVIRTSRRPYALVHRMKEFETETIFLGRSLNQLASRQNNRTNPVTTLLNT